MVDSYYQDAPLYSSRYCTFWSVPQPKATRAPRVPKTSKGIQWYKQLFSSINGTTENGPQLSPVHGVAPFPDKASKAKVEIAPVHEAPEKIIDKQDSCELPLETNSPITEVILCNGEANHDAPAGETEAEGDAAAMPQDHVHCFVVSSPCLVFSASDLLLEAFLD